MILDFLQVSAPPFFHLAQGDPDSLLERLTPFASEPHAALRHLRGTKMRTLQALFDETAASLQFPPYFGENWDALDECLNDLDWLPVGPCTLLLLDTQHLLDRAEPADRATLAEVLKAAAEAWNGSRPFHVILHRAEGTNLPPLARELRSLGAELDAPAWLA